MSAAAVIDNLDKEKYDVIMLGVTKEGHWYRYRGDTERIRNDMWLSENCTKAFISPDAGTGIVELLPDKIVTLRVDAAFPVMHGKNGEDGTVQGLIELSGIPLVGCGVLPSALCMDKHRAHELVSLAGVKTPGAALFGRQAGESEILKAVEELGYPVFVKPLKGGSSIGISKIYDMSGLLEAVENALKHDDSVIIEEAIDGFEVGCAVIGRDELTIGEVDEIEISGDFFDYTEKYTLKTSKIHMPARIDDTASRRIKETAAVIYRALGCSGFARVDMFLASDGEIYFNEVNTIPGFTAHSRFPNMLKGIGLSYPEILDRLIQAALAGGEKSRRRRTRRSSGTGKKEKSASI